MNLDEEIKRISDEIERDEKIYSDAMGGKRQKMTPSRYAQRKELKFYDRFFDEYERNPAAFKVSGIVFKACRYALSKQSIENDFKISFRHCFD